MEKRIEYVKFRDVEDHLEEYRKEFYAKYPDADYWDFIGHFTLDNCPFCGFTARINGSIGIGKNYGWCAMCGAQGPEHYDWEVAAKAWNNKKNPELFKEIHKYASYEDFGPCLKNFSKDEATQKMLKEFLDFLKNKEEDDNDNQERKKKKRNE